MKIIKIFLFLGLSVLSVSNASGRNEISVDPASIDAILLSKKSVSRTIAITNRGDEPVYIELIVKNLAQNLNGEFIFLDVPLLRSAREMIQLEQNSFQLQPGEERRVNFEISIPQKNLDGGAYAAIVARSTPVQGSSQPVEVGTPVLVTLPGKQIIKGVISGISIVQQEKGKPIEITMTFKNSGNTHFDARGEIHIKDSSNREITTLPLEMVSVLPGCSGQLKTILKPEILPPGTYTAEGILMAGSRPETSRKSFQIVRPLEMAILKAEISNLNIPSSEQYKPLGFQFLVVNTGNVDLSGGKGELTITDQRGNVVSHTSFKGSFIQPGGSKKYAGSFPKGLPPGDYTITTRLEYGGNVPAISQSRFKVFSFAPVIKGEIASFFVGTGIDQEFVPFFEGRVSFRNSGNIPVALEGTIELKDSTGGIADRKELPGTVVEPGKLETLISKWECNLPRGIYEAILKLNFENKTLSATTRVSVNP